VIAYANLSVARTANRIAIVPRDLPPVISELATVNSR
jgi:hypothetical protein